jgi:hypothetical protein
VPDQSQLVFNGFALCGTIDCVRMINEEHFISGASDGCGESPRTMAIALQESVCLVGDEEEAGVHRA